MLRELEPDVEALLVNRVGQSRGSAPAEYYIVPIDACYKLVGLIRIHWRGLSGGTEVWQEIGNFFTDLRARGASRDGGDACLIWVSGSKARRWPRFAASPQIAFKLRVTNADPTETIHSVALRCQIQIEVTRRRYTPEDQEKLRDLFGEPDRWSQTLRNLLWTHVNVNVPPLSGFDDGRSAGAMHIRFQCGRDEVFSRTWRW